MKKKPKIPKKRASEDNPADLTGVSLALGLTD